MITGSVDEIAKGHGEPVILICKKYRAYSINHALDLRLMTVVLVIIYLQGTVSIILSPHSVFPELVEI